MKAKPFALAAMAGSVVVAGTAMADFTGLFLGTHVGDGWVDNGYLDTGLVTYRLYAQFDGGGIDNGVLASFGVTGLPMSITSSDGMFYNDAAFDSLTAPLDLTGIGVWTNQWDTYVTINKDSSVGDATGLSPGFAAETSSLAVDWSTENAAWFVTPDDAQHAAVDWGGEAGLAVLLGQFSVASGVGGDIVGQLNLLTVTEEFQGLTFSSSGTPAPGALALLGLAGLAGRGRRRS